MPEGPEVETVVRTLEKQIKGNKIKQVQVIYPKIIELMDATEFQERIMNQSFVDFHRYGKFLVFKLSEDYLIVHLRMEGKFQIEADDRMTKHTHVIFTLDDGRFLKYIDTRKFGRLTLVKDLNQHPGLSKLGRDIDHVDLKYLKKKFHNKSIPIKQTLLDQSIITGIGNIYANEILFESRIHPLTPTNQVSSIKLNRLIKNTKKVLDRAIELGGTTIRSYTSSLDVHGLFDQELKVHQQSECQVCQTPIKKIFVNKRGTYYCPHCQKLKKLP